MEPKKKAFIRAYMLFALAFLMTACAYVYQALGDNLFAVASGLVAAVCVAAVVSDSLEPQKAR